MTDTLVMNENNLTVDNDNSHDEKLIEKQNDNSVTKNILLYKNGDLFFPAKRFVVNKKYIRNWESLLEELTKNLNPRNGAIRDIRTPFHGTRIKSLDDLTTNGKYVAISKGEQLKIIDYTKVVNINNPVPQSKNNYLKLKPIRLTNNEGEKIESRITQQLYVKSNIIHIFRNGDPFTRAIKVVIKPQEQKHMNVLVKAIEDRVLLQTNKPIRRLYTLNGDLVKFAKDIEGGKYYVAASHEPFENIKYGQFLPVIRGGRIPSKRNQIKYLNQLPTPVESERTQRYEYEELTKRSQKPSDQSTNKKKINTSRQQKNHGKQKNEADEAATKIQAAFRGFQTRKEIASAKHNNKPFSREKYVYIPKKQKDESLHKSIELSESTNKSNSKENKIKKDDKRLQEKSVVQEVKPQKQELKNNRNELKKDKPKNNKLNVKSDNNSSVKPENEEEAAIRIQAGYRGFKTRKELKDKQIEKKTIGNNKPNNKESKEKRRISPSEIKTQPNNKTKDNNLEKAAIKIQAGFRGYKTRESLKMKKQQTAQKNVIPQTEKNQKSKPVNDPTENDDLEKAATTIQASFRGYKARQIINKANTNKSKQDENDEDMDQKRKAAIKIQAGFRGYRTRQIVNKTNSEKSEKEKSDDIDQKKQAATKIQAGFRGFKARKEKHKQENAAKRIQAGFRGYKYRRETQKTKEQEKAAVRIQAAYRGFKIRREIKEKENAAEKIQAGYRSYQARKDMAMKPKNLTPEEQSQLRNDAATKIQAAFRGHIFRRENS